MKLQDLHVELRNDPPAAIITEIENAAKKQRKEGF